ncbi:MAG: sulfate ABC transporter substrate-binding protein [Rhodococcus sp. (in: high G+C Gram-positive bacteria)]
MLRAPALLATLAVSASLALTACSPGSSDTVGESAATTTGPSLTLVGYAVPKNGWDAVGEAFGATEDGENVTINADYGPSGNQSRKVADGAPADIVNFSVEPDVTRLVDAGKVDEGWKDNAYGGIPFGSVVSIVTRPGNPKNIRTWEDLLRPGVSVISPSPLSSGSAKWNLLAPYSAISNAGQNRQAGLDYVTELVKHFPVQPDSGRSASEAFLQGQGDVLLSYENEALLLENQDQPVEHIVPDRTFRIDNPVAVVNSSSNLQQANALNDFLYTAEGQKIWAENGFRPVDPEVAAEFAGTFPAPQKLDTIDDLGGWSAVDRDLFGENGAINAIYEASS